MATVVNAEIVRNHSRPVFSPFPATYSTFGFLSKSLNLYFFKIEYIWTLCIVLAFLLFGLPAGLILTLLLLGLSTASRDPIPAYSTKKPFPSTNGWFGALSGSFIVFRVQCEYIWLALIVSFSLTLGFKAAIVVVALLLLYQHNAKFSNR